MSTLTQCDTPGCGKPSKLRCPTCVKTEIVKGSNFCSQVFFCKLLKKHFKI